MNQVVLVGRLTSDPEAVKVEGGHKKSVFSVAVPRSYKNSNGEYETDFIKPSCLELEEFKKGTLCSFGSYRQLRETEDKQPIQWRILDVKKNGDDVCLWKLF